MMSDGLPWPPRSGKPLPGKGPDRREPQAVDCVRMVHARRKFFELADLARAGKAPPAPLAVEAVRRIDAIFAHERVINGRTAADRLAYRLEHAAPLARDLEAWMKSERAKLSRHANVARAMDYMLKR